ncbi:hypothetical protein [Actinoplanes sp. NPDC026619]|uniref:WXG100 family type VII secretion target n=1 Tax=Actinoplanes sp. NPDC026619 TaxID=3155798 RepID=UPI00340D1F64
MALQNRVDDGSLHPLVGQLEDAHGQLGNVHNNISESLSNLSTGWQGDASAKHSTSTLQWLDGLNTVRQGVGELHGIMSTHADVSARAEAEVGDVSSSWT